MTLGVGSAPSSGVQQHHNRIAGERRTAENILASPLLPNQAAVRALAFNWIRVLYRSTNP
jgi:hypothetical protein